MEHDLQLRPAARAIYDACYPGEEWAPVGFDEAELVRCPRGPEPADELGRVRHAHHVPPAGTQKAGDAAELIVSFAHDGDIPLIVMSSHGRTGVGRVGWQVVPRHAES